MRLFIAIPLPKGVKQQLLDLQQPIEGIRWQSQEQMHLTLKFVGEVDKTTVSELREELDNIVHSDFSMTISGIGYFPEGKQPKVVWAGIKENANLQELHKKVENRCEKMGIAPENRPYKPHVTIGRTKNAYKRSVTSFINQHKKFGIQNIQVNEFVLFESELHPDGARHHPLQTYLLNSGE
ncbi:RNA 2',3'-cyclic phosphodiesterase [Fodinibius sp.]|uniref:RNA 2',3'-cyclic phosphodiesterase n=1 Tax=Fodinibius sp. TaxID=1872440 RepID=UPI002ACE481C|nr:RNA 2',3'-cyclic phosphodiesterase [Fodinibius sp.]MDZ7658404.1 RNA 2',3'-cyclic phosphodiesterase [Fodinibius sp.]